MLIDFFLHLKSARLPVSTREFLTLLEALRGARGVAVARRLLRARAHVARQGRDAVRPLRPRVRQLLQGRRARSSTSAPASRRSGCAASSTRTLSDEDRRRVEALGGWDKLMRDLPRAPGRAEGAPRRRLEVDRHRRHQPVRRVRLQPRGHPRRPGGQRLAERGQGLGRAQLPQPRRRRRAQHAQHQARAAQAAPLRARGRARGARPRRHDPRAPRATPAGSTSSCSPSGATASRCCCSSTSAARWTRTSRSARSSSRRRRRSSATSSTSTSTTASTTTCGATTPGGATSASRTLDLLHTLRPGLAADLRRRRGDEPLRARAGRRQRRVHERRAGRRRGSRASVEHFREVDLAQPGAARAAGNTRARRRSCCQPLGPRMFPLTLDGRRAGHRRAAALKLDPDPDARCIEE